MKALYNILNSANRISQGRARRERAKWFEKFETPDENVEKEVFKEVHQEHYGDINFINGIPFVYTKRINTKTYQFKAILPDRKVVKVEMELNSAFGYDYLLLTCLEMNFAET